ncbi:MAG: hypothetical protein QXZ13_02330 [Candidatus Diapherotrites archaeon]
MSLLSQIKPEEVIIGMLGASALISIPLYLLEIDFSKNSIIVFFAWLMIFFGLVYYLFRNRLKSEKMKGIHQFIFAVLLGIIISDLILIALFFPLSPLAGIIEKKPGSFAQEISIELLNKRSNESLEKIFEDIKKKDFRSAFDEVLKYREVAKEIETRIDKVCEEKGSNPDFRRYCNDKELLSKCRNQEVSLVYYLVDFAEKSGQMSYDDCVNTFQQKFVSSECSQLFDKCGIETLKLEKVCVKKDSVKQKEEKSCSELNGKICSADETCKGEVISTLDTSNCCVGSCEKKQSNEQGRRLSPPEEELMQLESCSALGGYLCISNETCYGETIDSYENGLCCSQPCVPVED